MLLRSVLLSAVGSKVPGARMLLLALSACRRSVLLAFGLDCVALLEAGFLGAAVEMVVVLMSSANCRGTVLGFLMTLLTVATVVLDGAGRDGLPKV